MIKPIKRIVASEKDVQQLNGRGQTAARQNEQPIDYRDRVVIKPWGYEFLVFDNGHVAIWFLHIRKDHATSMHCHPSKKTALTLLSGKALCNTFRSRNFLNPSDTVIIDPAVFHSTKALSPDGICLVEVESPPGKLDLVRLEDNYGREGCGYEGCSQMVTDDLEAFHHFYFDEAAGDAQSFGNDNLFHISLHIYGSAKIFRDGFNPKAGELYCVCRGVIQNGAHETVIDVGEIERGGFLQQQGRLDVPGETVLMRFSMYT
ncbi:MAG: hypothetical protein WAU91_03900 [Desulfatitalea sp.]